MAEADPPRVGGILLAAGASSRMGSAKQLLQFEGTTLIRRSASALSDSDCVPCVVVLGAKSAECEQELAGIEIDICVNEEWPSGMSSSIKAGLGRLLQIDPRTDAVMITLCDQPHVSAAVINKFIAEYRRIRPHIIASEYNGVTGVPALFSRDMFDSILKLEGDRGAKGLIRMTGQKALTLEVPQAAFDIDSPADLMSVGETKT